MLWLHTFGDRFVDTGRGRPNETPRLPDEARPRVEVEIPGDRENMPDEIKYSPHSQTLHVGTGEIRPVSKQVWEYEVSGMRIVKKWFDYRKRKPAVRRASPLNEIHKTVWDADLTGELLDLLNVLGSCVALEPLQASILDRVLLGPQLTVSDLERDGIFPVPATARSPIRPGGRNLWSDHEVLEPGMNA